MIWLEREIKEKMKRKNGLRGFVFDILNSVIKILMRRFLHIRRPLNEVLINPKLTMNETPDKSRPCLMVFHGVVRIVSLRSF
jgi:hypothetical protein